MKNKKTAILLALFGGIFGLHRFYLGQIGQGILNFPLGIMLGPLFALKWSLSSTEDFDGKYNAQRIQKEMLNAIKNK